VLKFVSDSDDSQVTSQVYAISNGLISLNIGA